MKRHVKHRYHDFPQYLGPLPLDKEPKSSKQEIEWRGKTLLVYDITDYETVDVQKHYLVLGEINTDRGELAYSNLQHKLHRKCRAFLKGCGELRGGTNTVVSFEETRELPRLFSGPVITSTEKLDASLEWRLRTQLVR